MCLFKSPKMPPPVVLPAPAPAPAVPTPPAPPSAPIIINTPGPAAAPAPTPIPQVQDPAVQSARENERTRNIRGAQANNTLVTGGQGLINEPANTTAGGKKLLGE